MNGEKSINGQKLTFPVITHGRKSVQSHVDNDIHIYTFTGRSVKTCVRIFNLIDSEHICTCAQIDVLAWYAHTRAR